MTIWAIGTVGHAARCYVETTVPTDVIGQMAEGETAAPVTLDQKETGVRLLGDMQVELLEPEE